MWNKFINSRFSEKWIKVLSVLFSPGFFLSTVTAVAGLYLSVYYKTNVPFSNTMAIVGSIFSGIAGGFFKDEYDRMAGKNILEKKGRSALRNLEGITKQLCNIKVWIVDFSKKTKKQKDRRSLEEITRHISTIELNIASGLEDWVDIVPELKERTQKDAEIDKKYKEAAQSVLVELLEKRKELASTKDQKTEQEVKKKITDLEKQIKEMKKERSEIGGINIGKSIRFGDSLLAHDDGVFFSTSTSKKCDNCGKKFTPDYLSSPIALNNYCPECQANLGGGLISPMTYAPK